MLIEYFAAKTEVLMIANTTNRKHVFIRIWKSSIMQSLPKISGIAPLNFTAILIQRVFTSQQQKKLMFFNLSINLPQSKTSFIRLLKAPEQNLWSKCKKRNWLGNNWWRKMKILQNYWKLNNWKTAYNDIIVRWKPHNIGNHKLIKWTINSKKRSWKIWKFMIIKAQPLLNKLPMNNKENLSELAKRKMILA